MAAPGIAARRYAEAAFEVAARDDRYDRWRDDLALAADLLGRDEVEGIVDSPAIPLEQRLGAARELLGDRIGPEALRLVELLVKRGRVRALGGVAAEFARLLNRHRGVITATVTSAAPLTRDETAAIRTRVEAMAGSRVDLRTSVDPSIIGGLTVQVGDRLLDASIRGRLERLHAQLNAGARLR